MSDELKPLSETPETDSDEGLIERIKMLNIIDSVIKKAITDGFFDNLGVDKIIQAVRTNDNNAVIDKCIWVRAFDNHFNISCDSGKRANGQFKGKEDGAKWEFEYCPYCSREIELKSPPNQEEG